MTSPSATVDYPSSLPNPANSLVFTPVERRFMFGAQNIHPRPFEEGFRALVRVEFLLTGTHAEVFRDWWRVDLEKGFKKFTARWPNPQGFVSAVYRFRPNTIEWKHVGFDAISVIGECSVHLGRRMPRGLLLGLHFDGSADDVSVDGTLGLHVPFGFSVPAYPTSAPKFGSANYKGDGFTSPLISNNRFNLTLNWWGKWQISFFVKPETSVLGAGRRILALHNGGADAYDGTPESAQIEVGLSQVDPTHTRLNVRYATANPSGPNTGVGVWVMSPVGTEILIPVDGNWYFVAICGDGTSTRAYINTALALDDHSTGGALAGEHPVYAGANYINQYFIVGAAFGGYGGAPSPADWLVGTVWGAGFSGEIDDLQVRSDICEFTGSTIVVPTVPFVL